MNKIGNQFLWAGLVILNWLTFPNSSAAQSLPYGVRNAFAAEARPFLFYASNGVVTITQPGRAGLMTCYLGGVSGAYSSVLWNVSGTVTALLDLAGTMQRLHVLVVTRETLTPCASSASTKTRADTSHPATTPTRAEA